MIRNQGVTTYSERTYTKRFHYKRVIHFRRLIDERTRDDKGPLRDKRLEAHPSKIPHLAMVAELPIRNISLGPH